jgi:hypothetical protein
MSEQHECTVAGIRTSVSILVFALITVAGAHPAEAQTTKTLTACGLATAAELEAAIGSKIVAGGDGRGASSPAGGSLCQMQTATGSVLLRLAKKTGKGTGAAEAGIAMAKQMGAQVDVRTFGAITCSTMIPPKAMEQYGFNTTCAVDKGDSVAAVEVTAKSAKDMVSIDRLRPLAEKMATRF